MRRLALLGVFCLLGLLAGRPASAHPLDPLLLEIREVRGGPVEVLWRQPGLQRVDAPVRPVLPSRCVQVGPGEARRGEPWSEARWRLDCGGRGLVGERIGVAGLAEAQTDALLRIQLADGRLIQAVLRPDAPALTVLAGTSAAKVCRDYLLLGLRHILSGPDHLLFILGLVLLVRGRGLLWTITAFTLGHSVTLSLAVLGFVHIPPALVEVLIAASIFTVAVELTRPDAGRAVAPWRSPRNLAFGFGLLHGLGFAGVLAQVSLPAEEIPLALFSFNCGIEVGQLLFVGTLLLTRAALGARPLPRLVAPARPPTASALWPRTGFSSARGSFSSEPSKTAWLSRRLALASRHAAAIVIGKNQDTAVLGQRAAPGRKEASPRKPLGRQETKRKTEMSTTTLTIVLQGLLALVPNNEPGGTNQMTVLMLDGNHSHGIECMGAHTPELVIRADNDECVKAGCKAAGGLCTCEQALTRKDIWLEIQPQPDPPRQELAKDPPRAIPRNRQEAAELGYVANLARPPFNLSLNQQYLLASPPQNLVSRLRFPFQAITACALAKRMDGGEAYVHTLGFRLLGNEWEESEMSQAMAQMVIASITIPDAGAAGPQVILHLKNLDSDGEATIPLLSSGPQGYVIKVSNNTTPLPVDDPCDDGIARHFALFYELAQSPPPLDKRLIPHIRLAQSKCADALDLQACGIPPLHPLDHPICPLVMFNP